MTIAQKAKSPSKIRMEIGGVHISVFNFKRLLLIVTAIVISFHCYAQNPAIQSKLTATTTRQPAKPNDTIAYKAEITNLTDSTIFNLTISRTGDPNTTFIPGSFESTAVAVPANFANLKEDQLVTLALVGVDPDGDALDFLLIEPPQQGIAGGIASVSNTQASLTYQPNANFSGTDQFTFAVEDEQGNRDTSTVLLTIMPVNDAPGFIPGTDISINEDAGLQALSNWATNVRVGPGDEVSQNLVFNMLSNSNPDLFATLPGLETDGTLTFAANGDAAGMATIVLQLKDDGGTANGGIDTSARQTLQIMVLPVNDAPSFTAGAAIEIPEDGGAQVFSNWATDLRAGPADESSQMLEFQILNNTNPDLFSVLPTLAVDGTWTFTPNENANGTATILIQLKDDGGTANGGIDTSAMDTLFLTIPAINDAPSFVKGGDIVINTDTAEQVFENWATEIKAGPADEQIQGLTFLIENNDNPALFLENPQITANGTLRFKPAPDAVGVAMFTIRLKDDGGNVNGGIDISDIQVFSITLE